MLLSLNAYLQNETSIFFSQRTFLLSRANTYWSLCLGSDVVMSKLTLGIINREIYWYSVPTLYCLINIESEEITQGRKSVLRSFGYRELKWGRFLHEGKTQFWRDRLPRPEWVPNCIVLFLCCCLETGDMTLGSEPIMKQTNIIAIFTHKTSSRSTLSHHQINLSLNWELCLYMSTELETKSRTLRQV